MNLQEYRQLLAEKEELQRLLAELPADREIERIGLESRKQDIEAALATQTLPSREPIYARLTFRGKPIVGSHGIFAEFGANAVNAFAKAVSSIGASMDRPLGTRGQLPKQDEFRLLITGTALGSFGFRLEEAAQEDLTLFPLQPVLESAIEQTQAIMRATLGSDDELTDALADADSRALDALRKFLDEMANNEAVCSLEFKGDIFRFADVEQLRRSSNRLQQDNIHESEETLIGLFLGVLPNRRTFEFQVTDTQEIITGKVSNKIEDPTQINHILEQSVSISVHTRSVGEGKPRFALLSYSATGSPEETNDHDHGGGRE